MNSRLTSPKKRSLLSQIVALALVVLMGCGALWLFLHRQYVIDQIVVWQYQPSSEVASLASRTHLSKEGKFIFYAAQPAVEDATAFNKDCTSVEQSTAVLGCYAREQIYIYNVTDTRLDGIKETTAAHEMLHAAYERLSPTQRQHVNSLLEVEYAKLKDDKDFSQRMAIYARTEPGERDNELHSIIGTEVHTISPDLEAYYSQYFTDRQALVNLHDAYSSLFTQLSAKKDALAQQLTALKAQIATETRQYNDAVAGLNADIQAFNDKATANGFTSQADFDKQRSALMSRIDALDRQRNAVNADIATYQDLYAQYQAVVGQSETLNQSIDSKLAPAPSL